MAKQFLVIDLEDPKFTYTVDDLDMFISEMYADEMNVRGTTLEASTKWFLQYYSVFEVKAIENEVSIKEIVID